jgi:hypothetical protein
VLCLGLNLILPQTEESLAANPTTYVGGEGKVISTDRELEKVHMGLALKAPGFNDPVRVMISVGRYYQ